MAIPLVEDDALFGGTLMRCLGAHGMAQVADVRRLDVTKLLANFTILTRRRAMLAFRHQNAGGRGSPACFVVCNRVAR